MRWSYVISRVLILAVVWAGVFFGMDPAIKWSVKRGVEAAAGSQLDIGGLKTKLFPPSLTIKNLALADKSDLYKNLFQFKTLSLSLEGKPLLEKKLVIRESSLLGLRFGTQRALPAKPIPAPPRDSKVSQAFGRLMDQSKDFSVSRAQDIKKDIAQKIQISTNSLQSLQTAEKLRADFNSKTESLKTKFDADNYDEKINSIKTRIDQIQKEQDIVTRISSADSLRKDITALKSEVDSAKTDIASTLAQAKTALKAIDEARKNDLAELQKQLKLPSLDTASIA